jgi:hypothetical protein
VESRGGVRASKNEKRKRRCGESLHEMGGGKRMKTRKAAAGR